MIEKLYNIGCFNYEQFILNNTKALSIQADEAFVLIKILDLYKNDTDISKDKILANLNMTSQNLQKILAKLLEKGFYGYYLKDENGKQDEKVTLSGFFVKVEAILNNELENLDDALILINKFISQKLNRVLTSTELEIISSLVIDDHHTLDEFKKAIEDIEAKSKIITIKLIAQAINTTKEVKVSTKKNIAKDFMQKIV